MDPSQQPPDFNRSFVDQVIKTPARPEIIEYLLQSGIDVHANDDNALKRATTIDAIRLLLDHGANIHAGNDTALINAVQNNKIEIVQLLLNYGADIHAQNEYALRMACSNVGHTKMVEYLLSQGAIIRNDIFGPMYNAVIHSNTEIVKILASHGAVISDLELLEACESGRTGLVKLLVELGANPTTDKIRSWMSRDKTGSVQEIRGRSAICEFLTEQINQIQKYRQEQIRLFRIIYPQGLPTYPPTPVVGINPLRHDSSQ